MSGKVVGAIFDLDRYSGKTLTVALALAEWARDDGTNLYPKVEQLAGKAKASIRMTQYALAQLLADEVLVMVKEARRGRPAHYRIDLVRVQWLRCNGCGANDDTDVVQSVAPQSGVGVQPIAPPIEPSLENPLKEPSHNARAGARSVQKTMLLPISGSSEPAKEPASPLPELLDAEFQRCPGHKPAWTLADVRAGLAMLGADRPADGEILAAAQAWRRWLIAQNAKRAPTNPEPMMRPSKWLSSGAFMGFLQATGKPDAEIALRPSMADDLERLRGAGISNAEILGWFADCEKFDGAPVELTFGSDWRAKEIGQRFGAKLQRIYGEDIIIKSAKKERAA